MEINLNLPKNYVEINEEEMKYYDGGITAAGIMAAIAVGGSIYAGGRELGYRYYLSNKKTAYKRYMSQKWGIRGTALLVLGPLGASIFLVGFENKLYSYF